MALWQAIIDAHERRRITREELAEDFGISASNFRYQAARPYRKATASPYASKSPHMADEVHSAAVSFCVCFRYLTFPNNDPALHLHNPQAVFPSHQDYALHGILRMYCNTESGLQI